MDASIKEECRGGQPPMMTYVKLYVYTGKQDTSIFRRGGFRRPFIVTTKRSPDFRMLIDQIDPSRPLYALCIFKEAIRNGELSKIIDVQNMEKDDEVILLPCGINSTKLPLYSSNVTSAGAPRMIREGIEISRAIMFSRGNYEGYVDEMFIENPLDILKKKQITMSKGQAANTSEVASALWKERNKVTVVSKYLREAEEKRKRKEG
jgi:hypothetical protein